MPRTTRKGTVGRSEPPGTKAQRTFAKAPGSAAAPYGEGRRAHRVAYEAVKHIHEKVGDLREPKPPRRCDRRPVHTVGSDGRARSTYRPTSPPRRTGVKGPSDEQSAGGRPTSPPSTGGVDASAQHLYGPCPVDGRPRPLTNEQG
ncbi:ChaB family protein [Actinoallomurus iriomotensis]|uniref:Uncharacterized protein n=1 Tax=Actinoallomurus iriomotensis TaxID=478107 RepID=A0A9W6SER5_9ACTN|nr:ChaB family protein [Actinoallomurus iriomotensis]GLY92236.1 hypothetical protein Airi02_101640 [Actinoallomurus iriomotensis]